MSIYELTIKPSYVDWGVWEGVRELLQNAKDGEEQGYPMQVKYNPKTQWLSIRNKGAYLEKRHLVLGETDKRGQDLRGFWGEGFKLAWGALLRAKKEMWIKNRDERWEPKIQWSEKFQTDILAVECKKGTGEDLAVEVGNITPEEWKEIENKCLFLSPAKETINTSQGDILLDSKYKGLLFAKGLFICIWPHLNWGYDFRRLSLDRDRRLVDRYDVQDKIKRASQDLALMNAELLFNALNKECEEAEQFSGYWEQPNASNKAIADLFKKKYGEKALPVFTLAEMEEVTCYGFMGIKVSKGVKAAFEASEGKWEIKKETLKYEVEKYWPEEEINPKAIKFIKDLANILGTLSGITFSQIPLHWVSFKDPNVNGRYSKEGICISTSATNNLPLLGQIFIHEAAHALGGTDGTNQHLLNIQTLSSIVISSFWEIIS